MTDQDSKSERPPAATYLAPPLTPSTGEVPDAASVPAPPREQSVEELLRGFDGWLVKRGKSPTTRRLYLRNADEFLDWLTEAPPLPGEESDAIVTRYFKTLEESAPGNSGNLRRTTAARSFLTFMGSPPTLYRSRSGPYRGLRRGQGARYLDLEEIVAVLNTVRDRGEPQEVGIVGLLLFAEMSPRLLCSLTIADLSGLDVTGQRFRVDRGLRTWQFTIPVSIGQVLQQIGQKRGRDRGPLFVDAAGAVLTRQSLDAIMKQIGDQAGIPDLAAYRLTMSRSKRSGQGVGWDALPTRPLRGRPARR
ncbi:MAG: hypothetical protein JXR83_06600 [Deltaproteobacteria bacterium]|nr:hypothetical protein [Deltaproteobacteria bacterium]